MLADSTILRPFISRPRFSSNVKGGRDQNHLKGFLCEVTMPGGWRGTVVGAPDTLERLKPILERALACFSVARREAASAARLTNPFCSFHPLGAAARVPSQ